MNNDLRLQDLKICKKPAFRPSSYSLTFKSSVFHVAFNVR